MPVRDEGVRPRQARPDRSAPVPRTEGPETAIMRLQRTAGNAAVVQALRARAAGAASGGRATGHRAAGAALQRSPSGTRHAVVQRVVTDSGTLEPRRREGVPDALPALASNDMSVSVWLDPASGMPEVNLQSHTELEEGRFGWSADETIAVNMGDAQVKEFYATDEVIRKANERLQGKGSKLQLLKGGYRISNRRNDRLYVVRPTMPERHPDPTSTYLHLTEHQCIEVAERILGPLNNAVFRDPRGGAATGYIGPQGVIGAPRLANSLASKAPPRTPLEAAEEVNGNVVDPPGDRYGTAVAEEKTSLRNSVKRTGVNKHARPRAGEGITTQTIHNPPLPDGGTNLLDYAQRVDTTDSDRRIWDFHYGAVVATSLDKKSYITMENYNRDAWAEHSAPDEISSEIVRAYGARLRTVVDRLRRDRTDGREATEALLAELREQAGEERRQAMEGARTQFSELNRQINNSKGDQWYFQIHTAGGEHSFHEAHKDGSLNALTLVVTHVPEVMFESRSDEIHPVSKERLARVAAAAVAGRQRLTVDARARGGALPLRDLATRRGKVVADFLVDHGVDREHITVNAHRQSSSRTTTVTPSHIPHVLEPPENYTDV